MRLWRRNTLAFRLTWTLLLALALVLGVLSIVQVQLQEKFSTECARTNGLSLSEGLFGALHRSMLQNDRDGLRTEVRSIAAKSPNLRVRIYNKDGEIVFSSVPSEEGTRVDTNSEACVKCHAAGRPLERLAPGERTRTYEFDGHPALGILRPIENEPACSTSACHAHAPETRLLGVLDVTLIMGPVERNRKWTAILMSLTGLVALLVAVAVVSVVVRREVHAPLFRLIDTLDRLRAGDWKVRHGAETTREFARLGSAVNDTARDLEVANAELVDWAHTLEGRVERKTEELERAQQNIVQVERMASLGKLAAVVAHEINNPLASVVTYSRLLLKRADGGRDVRLSDEDTREILEGIASESARCGNIVSNLLMFARRTGTRMEDTDINAVANRVLFLLKHKMVLGSVESVTNFAGDLQPVRCDSGQVEQALLALCVNAIEAMPSGGTLTVSTSLVPPAGVQLEVSDTGLGIDPDVLPHIYEPFFTTAEGREGKGLGLGLSVTYGIVQHHAGEISVRSAPGEGTTFVVTFPGRREDGDEE